MSEEVKTTALALRSANRVNQSTFERICKFYYEQSTKIELKPKEEEIRIRLHNIWNLLGDILTDRQAVLAHIQWCKDEGYNIKESIAYEDLRFAKMLFGDKNKQDKTAQRAIMSEILLKQIKIATDKKKLLSLARLVKEFNELNDLKNHGTGPREWKPIVVVFDSDPETLKKQAAELRRKAEAANAEDINHEDLND